jgi:hypothetical protein
MTLTVFSGEQQKKAEAPAESEIFFSDTPNASGLAAA